MNVSADTLIFVTIMFLMHCSCGICLSKIESEHQQQQNHDRTKRFVFLKTSGIGYLVAIAIPTSAVLNQRVYMAVNFEAHYGLADADTFLDKFHHKWVGDTSTDSKRDVRAIINNNDRSNHFTEENNVYTRKNFYRILRQHIQSYGYNGTACLTRIICETSETPLYEYNGVFGNIFHILFSPSSSRPEKINMIYYDAELHGQKGDCQKYFEHCPLSFLDMISDMITIGMRTITKN